MSRPHEASTATASGEFPDAGTIQLVLAMAADELLTAEDARRELNLKSRQTVYNWLNDKNDPLTATRKGGWRIRRGDLAEYVERRSRKKGKAVAPERRESDQTLRNYLSTVLTITQAALEYAHACQVYQAAHTTASFDSGGDEAIRFAFIEKCGDERTRKREQLLQAAAGMDEKTLQRLRFMLPSISSSLALPAPEDVARAEEGQA